MVVFVFVFVFVFSGANGQKPKANSQPGYVIALMPSVPAMAVSTAIRILMMVFQFAFMWFMFRGYAIHSELRRLSLNSLRISCLSLGSGRKMTFQPRIISEGLNSSEESISSG